MSDGSLFRGTARAGDGACWMRDPTTPAAPIGPVLSHSFSVGSIFRDGIWGVAEAVRATHEVTSAREVERTSKVDGESAVGRRGADGHAVGAARRGASRVAGANAKHVGGERMGRDGGGHGALRYSTRACL